MLITSSLKTLPIIRLDLYHNKESSFLILAAQLNNTIMILKNHFNYQYKILTFISGVDYPEHLYRFQVVYELLSIKYNSRIRLKVLTDELTPLESIKKVFPSATWWESEVWDMFGIFFLNQNNLTRLLTDYGFQGYPLRKDFPLSGYVEIRYNKTKNKVIYETHELDQEYRTFEFISPWENK